MTTQAQPDPQLVQVVLRFPDPGPAVKLAYAELEKALNGTQEERAALGDPSRLARPWDPATCTTVTLRTELWQWLDDVVTWLNSQHTWGANTQIPSCWPQHPHLVHDLAVIADQRRAAGLALNSNVLEDWHRYALPAFVDRVHGKLAGACEETHKQWPGRARHKDYASPEHAKNRMDAFTHDLAAAAHHAQAARRHVPKRPRLGLVDQDTGEILD